MGQPWHELKGMHARGELEAYSSNFALYHFMSNRFNAVLRQHSSLCTEYSDDESWLVPPADSNLESWGHALRADVLKKAVLPIGVGIGVSLTSAKLAFSAAKTWARAMGNVLDLRLPGRLEKLLKRAPVRAHASPFSASAGTAFAAPLSDSRDLTHAALKILRHIYQEGPAYARAGVLLCDLTGNRYRCDDLFAPAKWKSSRQVMSVVDQLNERMGRGTVRFGREHAQRGWVVHQAMLSPRYPTR